MSSKKSIHEDHHEQIQRCTPLLSDLIAVVVQYTAGVIGECIKSWPCHFGVQNIAYDSGEDCIFVGADGNTDTCRISVSVHAFDGRIVREFCIHDRQCDAMVIDGQRDLVYISLFHHDIQIYRRDGTPIGDIKNPEPISRSMVLSGALEKGDRTSFFMTNARQHIIFECGLDDKIMKTFGADHIFRCANLAIGDNKLFCASTGVIHIFSTTDGAFCQKFESDLIIRPVQVCYDEFTKQLYILDRAIDIIHIFNMHTNVHVRDLNFHSYNCIRSFALARDGTHLIIATIATIYIYF